MIEYRRVWISTHRVVAVIALTMIVWSGCDDRDNGIRTYAVPKEEAPPVVDAAPPEQQISLPSGTMQWDVPDGWASVDNTIPMRFATLMAGEGPDGMEVAITQLGGAAGGVAANINRWRGQIGLPPASDDDLIATTRLLAGKQGAPGLMVDLVGPDEDGQPPRMLAAIFPTETHTWFIKAMGTRDQVQPHVDGFVTLCESVSFDSPPMPPPSAPPPVARSADAGTAPVWDTLPEGWTADAQPRPMSVASLTIVGGGQEASLTITPLGGSQDQAGNINRWRGQVGLPPAADPAAEVMPFEVAGLPGSLVDLTGADRHILGVISRRGDQTWFFKLSGPDPLVADQRAAFEAFVRSIRFNEPPTEASS